MAFEGHLSKPQQISNINYFCGSIVLKKLTNIRPFLLGISQINVSEGL
jgi:hypothetical protein